MPICIGRSLITQRRGILQETQRGTQSWNATVGIELDARKRGERPHSEVSYKRLEQGSFRWPSTTTTGRIALSASQLAALLDGCDWRAPVPRRRPEFAG